MTHDIGRARPSAYDALFQQKCDNIKQQFEGFNPNTFEAFKSAPSHFRMRAEFKIWHNANGAHYAMHKPGEYKQPIIIDTFDIGSETICKLMTPLLQTINESDPLKRKLFQIEFLTSKAGDAVVTRVPGTRDFLFFEMPDRPGHPLIGQIFDEPAQCSVMIYHMPSAIPQKLKLPTYLLHSDVHR